MNQEIKAKWVAALRSGKYKQGKGCLKTADGTMCCLGVLSDLFIQENPKRAQWATEINNDGQYAFEYGVDAEEALALPLPVSVWAGLDDESDPIILSGRIGRRASELNDGVANKTIFQHTFAEIADLIEKNL